MCFFPCQPSAALIKSPLEKRFTHVISYLKTWGCNWDTHYTEYRRNCDSPTTSRIVPMADLLWLHCQAGNLICNWHPSCLWHRDICCIYTWAASLMKGKVMTGFARCCMENAAMYVMCHVSQDIIIFTVYSLLQPAPESAQPLNKPLLNIKLCRLYLVLLCLKKKHGFDFAFCCSEQFNPGVIQMNCSFCQQAAAVKHMNCFSPADE